MGEREYGILEVEGSIPSNSTKSPLFPVLDNMGKTNTDGTNVKKFKKLPRGIDLSKVPRTHKEMVEKYGEEGVVKICEALGIDPAKRHDRYVRADLVEGALRKMDAVQDLSKKLMKLRDKHGFKEADISLDIHLIDRDRFRVDVVALSRPEHYPHAMFLGPRPGFSREKLDAPSSSPGVGVILNSKLAHSVEEALLDLLPQD